jgi:hypothetical protein
MALHSLLLIGAANFAGAAAVGGLVRRGREIPTAADPPPEQILLHRSRKMRPGIPPFAQPGHDNPIADDGREIFLL